MKGRIILVLGAIVASLSAFVASRRLRRRPATDLRRLRRRPATDLADEG